MSVAKTKVSESAQRLMASIDKAIGAHTTQSPMTLQEIAGVLGFMAGGAIGHGKDRNARRQLREMVVANVDMGIDALLNMDGRKSSLILPDSMLQ